MSNPGEKREMIAHFICKLYKYYLHVQTAATAGSETMVALPDPPINISTILVEESHAVAAQLARAVRNKCAICWVI